MLIFSSFSKIPLQPFIMKWLYPSVLLIVILCCHIAYPSMHQTDEREHLQSHFISLDLLHLTPISRCSVIPWQHKVQGSKVWKETLLDTAWGSAALTCDLSMQECFVISTHSLSVTQSVCSGESPAWIQSIHRAEWQIRSTKSDNNTLLYFTCCFVCNDDNDAFTCDDNIPGRYT